MDRIELPTSFVTKHDGDRTTVSGPWIENQRWVVQKLRQNVDAEDLLKSAWGVSSELALCNERKGSLNPHSAIVKAPSLLVFAFRTFLKRMTRGAGAISPHHLAGSILRRAQHRSGDHCAKPKWDFPSGIRIRVELLMEVF